jgi:hypothetical protein
MARRRNVTKTEAVRLVLLSDLETVPEAASMWQRLHCNEPRAMSRRGLRRTRPSMIH